MLNWWLGRPANDAPRNEDDPDAPETPARVFAARAVKSAFFGTPGYVDDLEDEDDSPSKPAAQAVDKATAPVLAPAPTQKPLPVSPGKPQGILLTPGTATTRRKTVTFGEGVLDNVSKMGGRSGIPSDCPGKFPSPWSEKSQHGGREKRKTNLFKTMEAARKETDEKTEVVEKVRKRARSDSLDSNEADMTLDLNEPHSQSGRYWKSEYEKYHDEAMAQMKKLVKYKQLAKSYAKKKDGEAIKLAEKLREEHQRVLVMEDKIAEMASQVASSNTGDMNSQCLMRELAKQTALAVQYRDEVEEFRNALQGDEAAPRVTSPRTAQTLLETSRELKKARRQLEELNTMRGEMHSLRLELQAAEKKAGRLRDQNTNLERDIVKAKQDSEEHERRRNAAESTLQQTQKDYDTIKELAKSQRRDAEHLLKRRHDQVVGLRKEISSLKDSLSKSNRNRDIADLIVLDNPIRETNDSRDAPEQPRPNAGTRSRPTSRDGDSLLDSRIPILASSTIKPQNVIVKTVSSTTTMDDEKYQQIPPLREITSLARNEAILIREDPSPAFAAKLDSPFTHSLNERFSNLSLESAPSPVVELPLTRPVLQTLKTKPQVLSPRPSMFNISSSPPKYNPPRPQQQGGSSSRLSSLNSTRARTTLPPDRAAAAKARLEQKRRDGKMLEKKGLQDFNLQADQKENIHITV